LSGGHHRWFRKRSTGEKRPVTRDNNSNITIIIIIIIITMLRCIVTGTVITDQTTYNSRPNTVTLDKTIKEAYSTAAATSNSHNLYSTITQKLQKHKNLKLGPARLVKPSIKYH